MNREREKWTERKRRGETEERRWSGEKRRKEPETGGERRRDGGEERGKGDINCKDGHRKTEAERRVCLCDKERES